MYRYWPLTEKDQTKKAREVHRGSHGIALQPPLHGTWLSVGSARDSFFLSMTVPAVAQSKDSHYRHWKTLSKTTYMRYRYGARARKGRKRGSQRGPGRAGKGRDRATAEGGGKRQAKMACMCTRER